MKRRWEEDPQGENSNYTHQPDIELHLETPPLPLEWQRCLDIQSGQIHFYNTKTQKRTSMDPRRRLELPPNSPGGSGGGDHHHPLSLDLELNLNCQSIKNGDDESKKKSDAAGAMLSGLGRANLKYGNGSCPSWLRLERDDQQQQQQRQEMVARVCIHCHLLVMLLKSSPICPNCKFKHSIFDLQNPPTKPLFIASHRPTTKNNQTQSLKSFTNPIQNKV